MSTPPFSVGLKPSRAHDYGNSASRASTTSLSAGRGLPHCPDSLRLSFGIAQVLFRHQHARHRRARCTRRARLALRAVGRAAQHALALGRLQHLATLALTGTNPHAYSAGSCPRTPNLALSPLRLCALCAPVLCVRLCCPFEKAKAISLSRAVVGCGPAEGLSKPVLRPFFHAQHGRHRRGAAGQGLQALRTGRPSKGVIASAWDDGTMWNKRAARVSHRAPKKRNQGKISCTRARAL